jgi:hypothetical protein
MGRKPLDAGDRRDQIVRVRIMNRTYGKLEAAAKNSGCSSVAEYVRKLISRDVNGRKEELGLLDHLDDQEPVQPPREVRVIPSDFNS